MLPEIAGLSMGIPCHKRTLNSSHNLHITKSYTNPVGSQSDDHRNVSYEKLIKGS